MLVASLLIFILGLVRVFLAFLRPHLPGRQRDSWSQADSILQEVKPPIFPGLTVPITTLGAIPDGETDCLPAIHRAISHVHEKGGGRVLIPGGNFYVAGPIHLRSHVELHLTEGAELRFSTAPEDYLPEVFTRWEGVELMNYSPLIYAFGQENVAITGRGTVDGQAANENWWKWAGRERWGWKEGMPSQQDARNRPELFRMNTAEIPARERQFGEGHYLRPNFIQFYRCRNILLDGLTIRNSPMWAIHPVLSENITVQRVKVISHGPNSDGCNPESCRNVLIQDCYFDTGDDCIALKSGRNQDGRNIGRAIEKVIVRRCEMKDGHGGIAIGSEISGGARNIFVEKCRMGSPNLEQAIRIKTNKARGGIIENLFFRDLEVREVKESIVKINMHYTYHGAPGRDLPVVRGIHLENVITRRSKRVLWIRGYDENNPVSRMSIRNCQFYGVEQGNDIRHVVDLDLENVKLNGEPFRVG